MDLFPRIIPLFYRIRAVKALQKELGDGWDKLVWVRYGFCKKEGVMGVPWDFSDGEFEKFIKGQDEKKDEKRRWYPNPFSVEKAEARCVTATDAGYTKPRNNRFLVLRDHWNRLPLEADGIPMTQNIFGWERFKDERDDMGGAFLTSVKFETPAF
ncbi:hypothetical protein BC829DRAFT_436828 [Chytridium lagenaria]|nr:hypothetical protein BC829DRAFT_436828 [Chytridium lagenaria]